jgi:hypothetical protein
MIVDQVIARLIAQVPGLSGRVEGAAELAALVRQDSLPQEMPAAFVLPLGVNGRDPDATAGLFLQMFDEIAGVILMVESAADPTGAQSLATIDSLIDATLAALAGWEPVDAIGVLTLLRGRLVSLSAGTVIYQLDFTLQQQLRIST